MKMQEVQAKARQLGINSFGKSKAELIREIQRKEGNFDCFGSAKDYCDQVSCTFRSDCLGEKKPTKKTKKSSTQDVEKGLDEQKDR